MADVNAIITALDELLERERRQYLEPCEANQYLERMGLLKDRPERCGLPLRRLLRAGRIPHAYQDGVRWRIPHSGNERNISKQGPSPVASQTVSNTTSINESDLDHLRNKIDEARSRYQPQDIECLIIAEAPPDSVERFFYYDPVSNHDHLFLGIVGIIYPGLKDSYLAQGRPGYLKRQILEKFKGDGFYLVDVLDVPKTLSSKSVAFAIPDLLSKLDTIIGKDTPIIIIKVNVFDSAFYQINNAGYQQVSPERIPFPASGQQANFRRSFTRALRDLGFERFTE